MTETGPAVVQMVERKTRKPRGRKPSKKRASKSNPLPPAVQPVTEQGEQVSAGESLIGLGPISEPKPGEPLSAEAEALLADLPEFITEGDVPPAAAGVPGTQIEGGTAEDDSSAAILAMADSLVFDADMVSGWIIDGCDAAAARFESDHWRTDEKGAQRVAKPAAAVLNDVWAAVRPKLPGILGRVCETSPNAVALAITGTFFLAPRISKQIFISRKRAAERKHNIREMRPPQPQSVPQPAGPRDQSVPSMR